jgi:hypothetical protein
VQAHQVAANRHLDGLTGRAVLDGVVEQVADDTLKAPEYAARRCWPAGVAARMLPDQAGVRRG